MNAKEYLMQFKHISREIGDSLEELNILRELVTKLKASSSDGERVMSSVNPDPMAEAVCKVVDIENEIKTKVAEMTRILRNIKGTISKVRDGDLRDLLRKRYIFLKTWEQIAVEMNYSYQWVCELHDRALIEVEKILDT